MPRPNVGRTVEAEQNLARRIAYERDRRDLSYEGLAKQLSDAGCPIAGSAIYKIEKGDPPRRISVDELATFADVFETSASDLLTPMELIEQQRAAELLAELQENHRDLYAVAGGLFSHVVDLAVVQGDAPDVYDFVMGHFLHDPLGPNEEETEADDDEAEGGADEVLWFLLTDLTSRFWLSITDVAVAYLQTLTGEERGEHPNEDDFRQWADRWVKDGPPRMPPQGEGRAHLIERVESWTKHLREANVEHQ